MSTITFERVLRDSQSNQTKIAAGDKKNLIYDFKVMIDGEHRATLSRQIYSKGYHLRDADHRPIKASGDWRNCVEIARKAEFEATITGLLDIIPTLAQMAERRAEHARKRAAQEAAEIEQERVARIERAGLAMYEALKAVERSPDCARAVAEYNMVRAAIAKAEGGAS